MAYFSHFWPLYPRYYHFSWKLPIIDIKSFYKLSYLHVYLELYFYWFLHNFPPYTFIWTTRLFGTLEYCLFQSFCVHWHNLKNNYAVGTYFLVMYLYNHFSIFWIESGILLAMTIIIFFSLMYTKLSNSLDQKHIRAERQHFQRYARSTV